MELSGGERPGPSGWRATGAAIARRRRLFLGVWGLLLLACAAFYPSLERTLSAPDYTIEGSESQRLESALAGSGFAGAGSERDTIAFYSAKLTAGEGAYRSYIGRVLEVARRQRGVERVIGPDPPSAGVAAGGHAAIASVDLGQPARERFEDAGRLQEAIQGVHRPGLEAHLTGFSPIAKELAVVEKADAGRAELIGVPIALVILLLALGAVVAAITPLLIAGAGLLLTFGTVTVLGQFLRFDTFILTIVTMIGTGIGIDYALFIVARFREELARSDPSGGEGAIERAVGAALSTSGRTILYSGVIVIVSLTSMLVVRAPLYREFVIGAAISVICALAAALTLLPALLAQLGGRINAGSLPGRLQPADARPAESVRAAPWARWALAIMRRPLAIAVLVIAVLLLAAAPVGGMRYGLNFAVPALSGTPSGKAARVVERSFGPGLLGPTEILFTARGGSGRRRARRGAAMLTGALEADRSVARITTQSYAGGLLMLVVPAVPIDSIAAERLVRRLRERLLPAVERAAGSKPLVGGWTAASADLTSESSAKLPVVIAITLCLATVLLSIAFRSIVLPIKAVMLNLLSTGAALGLVVLVFQSGRGEGLLGFRSPGFIQSVLPIAMYVVLFGLSMDYEVFLIRRIHESWRACGDNVMAVAAGVEHTARPISAAAAIMVAVFGSFVTAGVVELKEFGFALAVAIAIDATLVRLVLVPALMRLFGAWNWWLPKRIARRLVRTEPAAQ
ncbi:MAG: MMPL family transporter [Solirubrobacteraceae bacterium]